jgi:hypothetical protein
MSPIAFTKYSQYADEYVLSQSSPVGIFASKTRLHDDAFLNLVSISMAVPRQKLPLSGSSGRPLFPLYDQHKSLASS